MILVSILFLYIYIYIFFFFDKKIDGSSTHLQPDTFPILFLPDAELPSLEEIHSITRTKPHERSRVRSSILCGYQDRHKQFSSF